VYNDGFTGFACISGAFLKRKFEDKHVGKNDP
jgi:hypothetical protein